MSTKSSYQVPGGSNELNFVLARIADRLDKLEGIRGASEIEGGLSLTEVGTIDDDDGEGTRIVAESHHEDAPESTLAEGEWEISVYDDGANPVFRVRYNDAGDEMVGDVALL